MMKIRILHNMARSGGTLISKCLGCMKGTILLSEIHPYWTHMFNPLVQASEWFNLLKLEDLDYLRSRHDLTFEEGIELINRRCIEQRKQLVLRDWSHIDFTGKPFVTTPSYCLTLSEVLGNSFEVVSTATVRHPLNQWLSISKLSLMQGKLGIDEFLHGYLKFAEKCIKMQFIRYEDFTGNPRLYMKQLCESLQIEYDPAFAKKWYKYDSITGDTMNSRSGKVIRKASPAKFDKALLEKFSANPDYQQAIKILGYKHPA